MSVSPWSITINMLHVFHKCIHIVFTLLSAASPFSAKQFLTAFEDEFLEVVNAKQSLLKLKHKEVISPDIRKAIEEANDEDAKYILFEHLQKNATVDTLRIYCDVAIAASGLSKMQVFGRKMMDALPPKGWLELCTNACVNLACGGGGGG